MFPLEISCASLKVNRLAIYGSIGYHLIYAKGKEVLGKQVLNLTKSEFWNAASTYSYEQTIK